MGETRHRNISFSSACIPGSAIWEGAGLLWNPAKAGIEAVQEAWEAASRVPVLLDCGKLTVP